MSSSADWSESVCPGHQIEQFLGDLTLPRLATFLPQLIQLLRNVVVSRFHRGKASGVFARKRFDCRLGEQRENIIGNQLFEKPFRREVVQRRQTRLGKREMSGRFGIDS